MRRGGDVHLWSRGEELITHRFPEIAAAGTRLPDGTVLDGEVLAFRDDRPLPSRRLQQRIGRQKQVAQMVRAVPVVFMAYDILEDRRRGHPRPLRSTSVGVMLEAHLAVARRSCVRPSSSTAPTLDRTRGAAAELAGERGVEGLMLKRRTRPTASEGGAATGGNGRSIRTRSMPC